MQRFTTYKLHQGVLKVLEERGFTTPTAIQAQAIPLLLEHEGDFVGRAATGTGKTIAYGAPLLSKIDTDSKTIQAIILVPTRELCEQVGNELIHLAKHISSLHIEAIYGGTSLKSQINTISNGVQVIVATPGRLTDLVQRKMVSLSTIKYMVFDEADEMLLKGFNTDIDKILATANSQYATWLFSATMPHEINSLIKKYLHKTLKKIVIDKDQKTNKGITHKLIEVVAEEKLAVLLHHLAILHTQKGIIFCRTKSGVQKLYKQLSAKKIACVAIHGDLPQGLRQKMMDQFREGKTPLLIATDVASRGVDVEHVSFVIQYHLADTADSYTHRSGRTSRAGNTGTCITFVFPEEKKKFELLKKELNLSIKPLPLPTVKDQLANKAILWARKIAKEKPVGNKLESSYKEEFKKPLQHLSKEELLEKLLATYLREQQG